MRVVIRAKAAADLETAMAWISNDNPAATNRLKEKIVTRINNLVVPGFSYIGRTGQVPGTRELIVPS